MKLRGIYLLPACILWSVAACAQNNSAKTLNDYIAHAPFKMAPVTEPVFKSTVYNIKD
jgi:uncharacterized membrane protein YciS (DUF1049 family)